MTNWSASEQTAAADALEYEAARSRMFDGLSAARPWNGPLGFGVFSSEAYDARPSGSSAALAGAVRARGWPVRLEAAADECAHEPVTEKDCEP